MKLPGFTLHSKLGSGGMAAVYLATQHSFQRKVAIKIIGGAQLQPEQAERFLHEARIIAGLNHPHIVPVYDVGSLAGYHYMAMEHLPGNDLRQRITEGLDARSIKRIATQLASALGFAHQKGIVHRDGKPANVLFREDGSAVLTDFGIAKALGSNKELTTEGKVIGTPWYMSPEQLRGAAVDGRADLYALGVILFEMLTGNKPFDADDAMAIALKQIKDPAPRLPSHLAVWQGLLDRLLAKEPEARFRDAQQLLHALEAEDTKTTHVNTPRFDRLTLSLADDVPATTVSASNLRFEECRFRKLGVLQRYGLNCTVTAEDQQQLGILLGRLSSELLDWHSRRGKQAARVTVDATVNEWMCERLQSQMNQWFNEDAFAFLHDMNLHLRVKTPEGRYLLDSPLPTKS